VHGGGTIVVPVPAIAPCRIRDLASGKNNRSHDIGASNNADQFIVANDGQIKSSRHCACGCSGAKWKPRMADEPLTPDRLMTKVPVMK
jgi:hypothetical protein